MYNLSELYFFNNILMISKNFINFSAMIQVLLIDDEPHANALLQKLIEDKFSSAVNVVATVNSLQEARAILITQQIDLIFLDIHLPEENGFQLFEYFPEPKFDVIFVTAYDQYAIEAFKYGAFGYLLKPIDPELLEEMINRNLFKKESLRLRKEQIEILHSYITGIEEGKKRIFFPTVDGYELPKVSSIVYVKAAQNYSEIFFEDNTKLIVSQSLKEVHKRLPKTMFIRVHKSYIVAMDAIIRYNKKEKEVVLTNGDKVDVSYRQEQNFLNRIFEKSFS